MGFPVHQRLHSNAGPLQKSANCNLLVGNIGDKSFFKVKFFEFAFADVGAIKNPVGLERFLSLLFQQQNSKNLTNAWNIGTMEKLKGWLVGHLIEVVQVILWIGEVESPERAADWGDGDR